MVDLEHDLIHIFRRPGGDVYAVNLTAAATEGVSPAEYPDVAIDVAPVVGSREANLVRRSRQDECNGLLQIGNRSTLYRRKIRSLVATVNSSSCACAMIIRSKGSA